MSLSLDAEHAVQRIGQQGVLGGLETGVVVVDPFRSGPGRVEYLRVPRELGDPELGQPTLSCTDQLPPPRSSRSISASRKPSVCCASAWSRGEPLGSRRAGRATDALGRARSGRGADAIREIP